SHVTRLRALFYFLQDSRRLFTPACPRIKIAQRSQHPRVSLRKPSCTLDGIDRLLDVAFEKITQPQHPVRKIVGRVQLERLRRQGDRSSRIIPAIRIFRQADHRQMIERVESAARLNSTS